MSSPFNPRQITKEEHDIRRFHLFERTLYQNVKTKKHKNTLYDFFSYAPEVNDRDITTSKDHSLGNQRESIDNQVETIRNNSTSFWYRLKSLIFKKHIFEIDIRERVHHESVLLRKLWSIGLLGLPETGRHAIMFSAISIFSMKDLKSDQKRNAFVGMSNEEEFFSYEMKDYIRFIHVTLLLSMHALCEACQTKFYYPFHRENERYVEMIFSEYERLHVRLLNGASFPPINYRLEIQELVAIRLLWDTEPAIRAAFKRIYEIIPPQNSRVCPNLPYFILRIQKIAQPDYIPSPSDISLLPLGNNPYGRRFHSIVPQKMFIRYERDLQFLDQSLTSFHLLQHSYFHGIDVPYQLIIPRGRRGVSRFTKLFDIIIYTVDLTSYTQVLPTGKTKLNTTLEHLDFALNSAQPGTPVYIFYTHLDLFMEVSRVIDISTHDPDRPSELAHLIPASSVWTMKTPSKQNILVQFDYKSKTYSVCNVDADRNLDFSLENQTNPNTFIKDDKILLHIFSYLDPQSLVRVGSTNYLNYSISSQDCLWMRHCLMHNPSLTTYAVRKLFNKYFRHVSKKAGRVPTPKQYWKKMYTTNNYAKFKYLEYIEGLVSNVVTKERKCILRGSFYLNVGNDKLLRRAMSAVMVDYMQMELGSRT